MKIGVTQSVEERIQATPLEMVENGPAGILHGNASVQGEAQECIADHECKQ